MKHHFDRKDVQRLLDHAKAAPNNNLLHDDPDSAGPCLWLVGSDGVYLMSNGEPGLPGDPIPGKDASTNFVVYAREVDPTTMEFDAWWAAKSRGFGRDDGVDFLRVAEIETIFADSFPEDDLEIDITPKEIALMWRSIKKTKPPAKKPKPPVTKTKPPVRKTKSPG